MRQLSLFLLVLLPLGSAVVAQAAAAKPATRALRFYYAGFTLPGERIENPQARFVMRNGRDEVPFTLNPNAFSRTLDYSGPLPAKLLPEQAADTAQVETENPEPLAELQCPTDWQGILFLVVRNPAQSGFPFSFYPIECWGPSVPDGSVRVLNLCPDTLAAKIGSGQSAVTSRASVDLPMPTDRTDVPLKLAVERAGSWQRILSTAVVRPDQNKMLLVVFPNLDGTPRVVVVRQLPEPPEPTDAAKSSS